MARHLHAAGALAVADLDVHQHLWSAPLVRALAAREAAPRVNATRGLTVLHLRGEQPCLLELAGETSARRARLLAADGRRRALLCISSPLGIEWLPRRESEPLLDAYHEGALDAGPPFGVWGALALDRPDAADVDRALARGCVGVSLPAGALAGPRRLAHVAPILDRLAERGAPLFVHPGPGPEAARGAGAALEDPLWWPALTEYVAGMQSAWLAFAAFGRREHPRLAVVFAMLAGLAPLHSERLAARGGPSSAEPDPLSFYETSSYGRQAVSAMARAVGDTQLLHGSDRPVVHTALPRLPDLPDTPLPEPLRRLAG